MSFERNNVIYRIVSESVFHIDPAYNIVHDKHSFRFAGLLAFQFCALWTLNTNLSSHRQCVMQWDSNDISLSLSFR